MSPAIATGSVGAAGASLMRVAVELSITESVACAFVEVATESGAESVATEAAAESVPIRDEHPDPIHQTHRITYNYSVPSACWDEQLYPSRQQLWLLLRLLPLHLHFPFR